MNNTFNPSGRISKGFAGGLTVGAVGGGIEEEEGLVDDAADGATSAD